MKHDGRTGAADCIGKGNKRGEVKDYARPLRAHDIENIAAKPFYKGSELTVVALRGGFTPRAAERAKALRIELETLREKAPRRPRPRARETSQAQAMLAGGGLGAFFGSALDRPGEHGGKFFGAMVGVLLANMATRR